MASDASLGRAVLILATDTGEFTTGIAGAEKQLGFFKTGLGSIRSGLSALGPLITGAFAAGAILSAGKAALDYAGRISDISARMRISTTTAQEWESAFGKAGISLETVAKASETLTSKIVGGDKSAVAALEKMGFSVEQLRAMKPEDRFNAVADAVGRLGDEAEQVYAAKTLFGKGGPELLAALDGSLESTIGKMRDMGLVIDEQTMAAADELGDTIGLLGKQLAAIVATVVGPLLPALTAVGNVLMWLGANVIGPVLNVTVKAAISLLVAFWQTLSGLLAKVAEVGALLPGIGGKFSQLAAWLKTSTEASGAYLTRLWAETDHTGESAQRAAPKLLGLGEAAETTGKRSERAAGGVRAVKQAAAETEVTVSRTGKVFGTFILTLEQTRTLAQGLTADGLIPLSRGFDLAAARAAALAAHQEALARSSAALAKVIANQSVGLIQGGTGLRFVDTELQRVRQSTDGATSGIGGLFGRLQQFVTNIPGEMGKLQKSVGGVLTNLFGASTNSMLGGIINGGLSMVFGPATGLITQWAMKGMQALGQVVWTGLKKVGSYFKQLFGGPSAKELAGREIVEAFESNLSQMLTDQQRIAAGGESWKETVIAIRDRYLEMGLTEEEALKDAERLWKSSKEGAEAARRVIEDIQRKFGDRGITVPIRVAVDDGGLSDLGASFSPAALGTAAALQSAGATAGSVVGAAAGGGAARVFTFGRGGGTAILELNGKLLAEAIVPELPGVVRRYGLAR